jgi:hypothetical protein
MPKLYLYAGAIFAVGILIGVAAMWFVDWQFIIKDMQKAIYNRDKRIEILSNDLERAISDLRYRPHRDIDIMGIDEEGDD